MNETLLGKENGNALMDLFLNSTSMYYRIIAMLCPTPTLPNFRPDIELA